MRKQAIVVGLGQFGAALTRSLAARGVEVLAVDTNEERVQAVAAVAAHAAMFDATEEAALQRAAPERRDLCVCAIGEAGREASILTTALLRQMGAPRVVARAMDPLHERILRLVGAHEVVNPERAFGERLASRLLTAGVIDEVPLGDDLVITELRPPPAFVGRTLADLTLPKTYSVTVVAVRRPGAPVTMPTPATLLTAEDILVIVSPPGAVPAMMDRVAS
ncbi:MAG: TrkA family potassium uptake protein [Polyangiaceae bacterium]|nr:TrkA family potassium uptake protein [Polyangiaceae bacterium]